MIKLGIDIGTSTIKLAALDDKNASNAAESKSNITENCPEKSKAENRFSCKYLYKAHHGKILETLNNLISKIEFSGKNPDEKIMVCATGSNSQVLLRHIPLFPQLGDIPAIVEGVRYCIPEAESIIDIGAQGARFITDVKKTVPQFSVNEHCAGGTGSFFEDQMSRLGMKIEDYSKIVKEAASIPRLSGRCAVFAKTDIIHRQQEGVSTPDILLGLCYAMVRNYKATIVRNLPVGKPVVFCGGVTKNSGAVQAVYEIFSLKKEELIIPENPVFMAALGSALKAEKIMSRNELLKAVSDALCAKNTKSSLEVLSNAKDVFFYDPKCEIDSQGENFAAASKSTLKRFGTGLSLGIDIGSTSTDLVLIDKNGKLIDFQYLRTGGNPENAVRQGLKSIKNRFGKIEFDSVGITGSGRERIGKLIGADAIRDEISAQAKGACFCNPEADTVFEIGGQDSKYISIKNGEVSDFMMNKICAAGTGSFIEEQASRMNIPLEEFGKLALSAASPAELGERCTVFIKTAIDTALGNGVSQADIAAGLCHSVVRNYITKVVASHPVGQHIVLQGGVAYNPGIVAAFRLAFGSRLTVSPYFSISGAFGAALISQEFMKEQSKNGKQKSSFRGFDFSSEICIKDDFSDEIKRNINFYRAANKLLLKDYDSVLDSNKKTVGIPYALMMHKFFPMANAFFKSLGFNILLSSATNEDIIQRSQQYAQGETCFPVKLMYGHFMELAEKGVDYIFMPNVHTVKHATSNVAHNYGCVYMQNAPRAIAKVLKLNEKGIDFLNPTFDLDMGKTAMAQAMVGLGKKLGFSVAKCTQAMMAGGMAVMQHQKSVEKLGQELLSHIKPDEKVLVLITRNYGISDPILNMGIPELLLEHGHKVITLEHLPAHEINLTGNYDNLYWPFAQHIISGAKIIASHPNLYAVYLTNHGCGPDTMLSYLFKEEMGEKPYLQIEVDEHFSKVGVITRIEAFLNSLSHRPSVLAGKKINLTDVKLNKVNISGLPKSDKKLFIPAFGFYSNSIAEYYRKIWNVQTEILPKIDRKILLTGREETTAKEYLPFTALLGSVLSCLQNENPQNVQIFIPQTQGAEADGEYARVLASVMKCHGFSNNCIVSPILETLPESAADCDFLFSQILKADLMYAEKNIQNGRDYTRNIKCGTLKIGVTGTPMTQTNLNEGVLDILEQEGNTIIRAPLAEYLLFLWLENPENENKCKKYCSQIDELNSVLGEKGIISPFAKNIQELKEIADKYLPNVNAANIRYRFAKAVELGFRCDAVFAIAPRYENAAMVMDMAGLSEACQAPLNLLYIDGDWDESAWERLRSFLYYCGQVRK